MRVLIVQYAGDYREAYYRFAQGGGETYYAQKYSVDFVAQLGQQIDQMGVLCCMTASPYDEMLSSRVRAIGAGFQDAIDIQQTIRLIEQFQPTHLILAIPDRRLLRWINQRQIPTLAMLADSFQVQSFKTRIINFLLARRLNHPTIQWIGNHGITAAQGLCKMGVDARKIIPWDWPHRTSPDTFPTKSLKTHGRDSLHPYKLIYVGTISEQKGLWDLLQALARLRAQNFPVVLQIVGKGDVAGLQTLIRQLEIADQIDFLGVVENSKIVELMRLADLVVVPSRREYPEGFPMTIYEALCSRTPVVVSDHPMFTQQLKHRVNALIFRAGDVAGLAACIQELLNHPQLYQQISQATLPAWKQLQIPVQWGQLIQCWLSNSETDRQWLTQYSLNLGQYDQPNFSLRASNCGGSTTKSPSLHP